VWVHVSFIDLGELKRRAHNGGDYKVVNDSDVFFWLWESVLVRLGSPFIDNWERARYLHLCLAWLWGLNSYGGPAQLPSLPESLRGTREPPSRCVLSRHMCSRGVHLERIIITYPWMMPHLLDLTHRGLEDTCLDAAWCPLHWSVGAPNDVLACCHLIVHCRPITIVGHYEGYALMTFVWQSGPIASMVLPNSLYPNCWGLNWPGRKNLDPIGLQIPNRLESQIYPCLTESNIP
jgi:hypothetical protein